MTRGAHLRRLSLESEGLMWTTAFAAEDASSNRDTPWAKIAPHLQPCRLALDLPL